jgi:hypothetical protein
MQVVKGKNRGGIDIKPAHVPLADSICKEFRQLPKEFNPRPWWPHNERLRVFFASGHSINHGPKQTVFMVSKLIVVALSRSFEVRNHLWVFINCLIENPAFDSQTKEPLGSRIIAVAWVSPKLRWINSRAHQTLVFIMFIIIFGVKLAFWVTCCRFNSMRPMTTPKECQRKYV